MQHLSRSITALELEDVPRQISADAPTGPAQPLGVRTEAAAVVASHNADEVDQQARFPFEAFEAIRTERLLGIMLPAKLGGEGASLAAIVNICYRLGQACASTAMIYAMHQSCVACVLRHAQDSAWQQAFLRRIASEQLLLASSTTEGQTGGNLRSSSAPIERSVEGIQLGRDASVISYGAYADAILATARRSSTAAPSDQVLVAFEKNDYNLEATVSWDTLGMRGTSSCGFHLRAAGHEDQILPEAYDKIHPQTMVPVSHLTWASTWTGIAAAAVERARAFVRRSARQSNGTLPAGAAHVTKALSTLHSLCGLISSSLHAYAQHADDFRGLMSLEFQSMINLTKVEASEMAVSIVMEAWRACGLVGYRNDSEFSIGRNLRDVLSAPIMISNDRILANTANSALLAAAPSMISG